MEYKIMHTNHQRHGVCSCYMCETFGEVYSDWIYVAMNKMENRQDSTESILKVVRLEKDINSITSSLSKVTISEDKTVNIPKTTQIKTKKNKPKVTQKVASTVTQNYAPKELSIAKQPQVKNNHNKKIGITSSLNKKTASEDETVNLPKTTQINTKKNKTKVIQKVALTVTEKTAQKNLSTDKRPKVKNNLEKELKITSALSKITISNDRNTMVNIPKATQINTTLRITPTITQKDALAVTQKTAKKKKSSAKQVKKNLDKEIDIMQTFNKFKNVIQKDSLTHFINQHNSKVYNLKMELHPGNMSIKTPAKWQIRDQVENDNPFTFAAFMLRKKEYDIINHGQFEVVQMYHNTPLSNAPHILVNNFDYRKNLRSRRRYGPGTCFSSDLHYCFQCTDQLSDKFSLIISDVLIGKTVDRDKYKKSNRISIDTGVSLNKKVFVKARDDEFYPKYIMTYKVNKSVPQK